MQPYLFPYIGYFQLLSSVDKFVVYDDVSFIKQGWINRNNILLNGQAFLFTVPLLNASSNTLIKDTAVSNKVPWGNKLLRTIEQAYRKAPQYVPVAELISKVVSGNSETIGELATASIKAVAAYLDIDTEILPGSSGFENKHLSGEARVIDICKQEKATRYHNPIGGKELYSKAAFEASGIELRFVKSSAISYSQYKEPFVPWLSIIDVLMFNDVAMVNKLIRNFELI
jgi:hypothetical protein